MEREPTDAANCNQDEKPKVFGVGPLYPAVRTNDLWLRAERPTLLDKCSIKFGFDAADLAFHSRLKTWSRMLGLGDQIKLAGNTVAGGHGMEAIQTTEFLSTHDPQQPFTESIIN